MHDLTRYKLALVVMAAIVVGYGIRSDNPTLRWVGIGLLVCALLLRFVRPRSRE